MTQEEDGEELLRQLQITLHIKGDNAEILLHIVHDEALVYDINGPVRHHFFQVIGQRLPSQVNSLDPIIEGEVLEDRSHVGEWESAVHDKATLGLGGEAGRPDASLIEVDKGRRVGDAEGPEVKVLEDEGKAIAFDGGECEEREG